MDSIRLFDGFVYDRHAYGPGPGRDTELLTRGLEPPSEAERRGGEAISPVDFEIFQHKMTSIVEEAREVYVSLSISEAIITGDMNASIFTAAGDPAVVATGIYFHALLNYAPVKYILRHYRDDPTVGLRDGDVFFFNDPTCGGVHTYDMFLTTPIFVEDTLVGWAEVGGHQGECGSISPGGQAPYATSRWEEGLHVPALRIGENWDLRRDILDFMLNAVRNPFVLAADLRARLATCRRIRDRVVREVERRGIEFVVGGLRRILAETCDLARGRIRELPDGIYRHILFNDNVGTEPALIRLPTTVIKEGDQFTVLIQGASPENHRGPMHATWHLCKAAMGVYLFTYLFRGLPPNAGIMEAVRVLVEGPSVANAGAEIANGYGTQIASILCVQNLHVIGSKLLFASPYRGGVSAPQSRNQVGGTFAGVNQFGYMTANVSGGAANTSGQGARYDMDGEDAVGFFWAAVTDAGEAEEADTRLPPLTLARVVDTNTHGFGKYRGGSPMLEISMARGPGGCAMTTWGSGDHLSLNPGLFGGYSGPPNPRLVVSGADTVDLLARSDPALRLSRHHLLRERPIQGRYRCDPACMPTEHLQEGDILVHEHGGGGGYGDVLERDPSLVAADLRAGAITPEVAWNVYRVVYDPDTGEPDLPATQRARDEERAARRRRGRPFAAFMAEWRQRRPKAEFLKYYGSWPEPRVADYDRPFWGLYGDAGGGGADRDEGGVDRGEGGVVRGEGGGGRGTAG